MPSDITTRLRPDAPLVQSADYKLDGSDRQKIDDQILGCQQHLADNLINGVHASWFTLDASSAALAPGDCFCLSSSTTSTVTLATATPILKAGMVLGVALAAAAPGSKVRGAISGTIPALITGLAANAEGFARLSSAGGIEVVSALAAGDYPIGTVDSAGGLTLDRRSIVGADTISILKGADGVGASDGAPVLIQGGDAGDTAHKGGSISFDLGTPGTTDGLTGFLKILAGTVGAPVLTAQYDDGTVTVGGLIALVLALRSGTTLEIDAPTLLKQALTVQTILQVTPYNQGTPAAIDTLTTDRSPIVKLGPLTANVTTLDVAPLDGVEYTLFVRQDGTGGRTIGWGGNWSFATVAGVQVSNVVDTTAARTTMFKFSVYNGVAHVWHRAVLL